MVKYNGISENEELNKFYKIENIENTEVAELQDTNGKKPDGLGFTSDVLLNGKMTLLDFSEMTGLEVFNKTERK
jgi:hypothetical protein